MKLFAPLFLTLSMATLALAENLATTSRDANFRTETTVGSPETRAAIEQLNRDVKAWNARCVVTNSDAEQSWCERERAALEKRKVGIKDGIVPFASKGPLFPTVNVTLRYSTHGTVLKTVQTDSTGHFDLGTFPASGYIMEFRARRAPGIESQRFAIQVDGIKAYGKQSGILAKYLLGGFGIEVDTAPGTPVKGVITTGSLAPTKKMIWIRPTVGSHFPGFWAEEGSSLAIAGAGHANVPIWVVRRIQDHGDGLLSH